MIPYCKVAPNLIPCSSTAWLSSLIYLFSFVNNGKTISLFEPCRRASSSALVNLSPNTVFEYTDYLPYYPVEAFPIKPCIDADSIALYTQIAEIQWSPICNTRNIGVVSGAMHGVGSNLSNMLKVFSRYLQHRAIFFTPLIPNAIQIPSCIYADYRCFFEPLSFCEGDYGTLPATVYHRQHQSYTMPPAALNSGKGRSSTNTSDDDDTFPCETTAVLADHTRLYPRFLERDKEFLQKFTGPATHTEAYKDEKPSKKRSFFGLRRRRKKKSTSWQQARAPFPPECILLRRPFPSLEMKERSVSVPFPWLRHRGEFWSSAHLLLYLTRPSTALADYLAEAKQNMGWPKTDIVPVQGRDGVGGQRRSVMPYPYNHISDHAAGSASAAAAAGAGEGEQQHYQERQLKVNGRNADKGAGTTTSINTSTSTNSSSSTSTSTSRGLGSVVGTDGHMDIGKATSTSTATSAGKGRGIGRGVGMIGLHVRHSDSCLDGLRRGSTCSPLPEYMAEVDKLSARYNLTAIYLATDDEALVRAAPLLYPGYQWYGLFGAKYRQEMHNQELDQKNFDGIIGDYLHGKGGKGGKGEGVGGGGRLQYSRFMFEVHRVAIADMVLLSECDAFVGKFTSNLFRLAVMRGAARAGQLLPYISMDALWCNDYGRVTGKVVKCANTTGPGAGAGAEAGVGGGSGSGMIPPSVYTYDSYRQGQPYQHQHQQQSNGGRHQHRQYPFTNNYQGAEVASTEEDKEIKDKEKKDKKDREMLLNRAVESCSTFWC